MYELRQAMLDAATPEILKSLTKVLAKAALEGDVAAAKVFLSYAVGQPIQAIELSGPDGEALGVDWGKVQSAISAALAPFGPEAKLAVAVAIRGAVDAPPD